MSCSAGGDLLRRRRRSLASSSTGRLLSLAEAQERERAQSAGYIEVGGGPAALPSKYHTVVDFPKASVVVQFCYYVHTLFNQVTKCS